MSLKQLDSQIEDLRAQAASLHKRGARTRDSLAKDSTLSDIGKRQKLDSERAQMKDKLSTLRAQEKELIDAKRQSIERRLFGLPSTSSSDPNQLIAYRDAQDRASKVTESAAAQELFASAMQSGDRTLAAAVVARALALVSSSALPVGSGWARIVNEYAEQYPSAGEDLADLIGLQKLQRRRSVAAALAYHPN
ncbi:Uncharacterised protein [Mycolicibacterium vanbaalenii]|uniref:Uncharacterized protein n=1 Tax=Mycolicibacterium vanbaalenii TaxID=110539 RepID=A0A5S9R9C8_MYCVN|nr:hypothetical protein [Mycolicibacterium vanbaalenii]CAA0136113.1 Uncharacterised protein [Mycolicibacterium vanbaalenii]